MPEKVDRLIRVNELLKRELAETIGRGISGAGSKVKIVSVQNSKGGMTSLIDSLNGYSFMDYPSEDAG